MIEQVKTYIEEVQNSRFQKMDELEAFRIKYLGKKGLIPALFGEY